MKSSPQVSIGKRNYRPIVHHYSVYWCMGRTNIHIDNELIDEVMQMTGAKSKRKAVDIALRRLVEKGTLYKAIRDIRGELAWEGDIESWRSSRSRFK